VSKQFGCKSVHDDVDVLSVRSVVHMVNGGVPGMITDNSETL